MGPSLHGVIQRRRCIYTRIPYWYQTSRCWRRPTAKALLLAIS